MKSYQFAAAAAVLASSASAQLSTITTGPVPTYTGTYSTSYSSGSSGWGPFGGANWGGMSFDESDSSAWSSYTSAHPNGPSASDWSSFTSAHGISNGPWGSGTPTGSWFTKATGEFGGGPGGWSPGSGSPFGGGNWGQGPWSSGASWTAGPWTSWWNGNSCPSSDWPGWTSGSWSTSAPWTSWTGCTASPTATSVYTTTSNGLTYTTTGFGYQLAQVSGSSSATPTKVNSANSLTVAGGAAAAALMGVIAAL